MRLAAVAIASLLLGVATPALAASTYIALGDSITFGEGNLDYVPSYGDRGYVAKFADILDARNGAAPRPTVFNFAIDGETASSFQTGVGRTPPVAGRTDAILAGQNLNYMGQTSTSQAMLFANTVASQKAAGNSIDTITITLGFNEIAALTAMPNGLAQGPATLATYQTNYTNVLTQIRTLAPTANLYLLNYFNPFPGDPTGVNLATPIFAAAGAPLNAIIKTLATQFNANYVDNFTPFVGHEAEYTYIDEQPAGYVHAAPFGGAEAIGNVHPVDIGYAVIARDVAAAGAVPEPGSWTLLITGFAFVGLAARRRQVPVSYSDARISG